MKVELIPIPEVISGESVKQYLADCSSVVRNSQPKDNDRLFERLMKESYGDKPSRVFEYVPCTFTWVNDGFEHDQYFGFWTKETKWYSYHTTARELLNWGWSWEEVLEVVDFTHYRAVKCTAPYFIYGQLSTHTQITSVSHSNRYTESGLGYWMPEEFSLWFDNNLGSADYQEEWNFRVEEYHPKQLQSFMKDTLDIKRREVYARGSDMLEYRVFCLGGYLNNPNAWPHFINQRLHDPHTQKETRDLVALIEGVLK